MKIGVGKKVFYLGGRLFVLLLCLHIFSLDFSSGLNTLVYLDLVERRHVLVPPLTIRDFMVVYLNQK